MSIAHPSPIKKVLLLCDFFSSLGGTENYNATLARGLRDSGIEVRIYVGEKPKFTTWQKQLTDEGFFFSTPDTFHTDLTKNDIEKDFINSVIDEINEWKPDVIHAHPFRKSAIQWLANTKADHSVPLVVTEWTVPNKNASHWFESNALDYIHQVAAYIATCHAITEGVRNYHHYSGPIIEIPHLIKDIPETPPSDSAEIENSVGCISRLSTEKGLMFLLGAWRQIITKLPNKKLYIYGHGPDQENLQLLSDCLGLQDSVIFAGTYQPKDVYKMAARHSIFVQPSLFESIPTSIIELMLSGRVVVASDVGGISELVHHNENGIIVTPGSTDKIADELLSLFASQEKIKNLSETAYRTSRAIYDYDSTMKKIIALYEEVYYNSQKSSYNTQ